MISAAVNYNSKGIFELPKVDKKEISPEIKRARIMRKRKKKLAKRIKKTAADKTHNLLIKRRI